MQRRRRRPESGRNAVVTPCPLAREAISALADGERPPVAEAIVAAHITDCQACREFGAGVMTLKRRLRLEALAIPTGGGANEVLALLGNPGQSSRSGGESQLPRPGPSRGRRSWARATRWAVGLAPLGFALPALALGVFAHVHVVPSHVLSPCTLGLHHVRGR